MPDDHTNVIEGETRFDIVFRSHCIPFSILLIHQLKYFSKNYLIFNNIIQMYRPLYNNMP